MRIPPRLQAIADARRMSLQSNAWVHKTACTAPKDKLRLVHIDPRDHEVTPRGDYNTPEQVRHKLNGMVYAQREVMAVFNDKGERVNI